MSIKCIEKPVTSEQNLLRKENETIEEHRVDRKREIELSWLKKKTKRRK